MPFAALRVRISGLFLKKIKSPLVILNMENTMLARASSGLKFVSNIFLDIQTHLLHDWPITREKEC